MLVMLPCYYFFFSFYEAPLNVSQCFLQEQTFLSVSTEEVQLSSENGVADNVPENELSTARKTCKAPKAGDRAPKEAIQLWKENGFSRYLQLQKLNNFFINLRIM